MINLDEEIKNKIKSALGAQNVIDSPAHLIEHGNPDIIVNVSSVSEIRTILKIANDFKIPVVPKSSSFDYSDGAIPEHGGILLNMTSMKKIKNLIEGTDRNVTVEPGVTFEELQSYLNEKGYQCMVPLGLPSQASVLTAYIERTPLLSGPMILLSEGSQCIMDMLVMRADGTTLHTGSGEIVPQRPGICHFGPVGPDWGRVFTGAQGTMGIVAELTLKFKHVPTLRKVLLKPYDDLEELLIDARHVKSLEIGRECLGISNFNMAAILANDKKQFESLRKILPPWTLLLSISGWEDEELAVHEADLEDIGIHFSTGTYKINTNTPNIEEILLSELNLPNRLMNFRRFRKSCRVLPYYARFETILRFTEEMLNFAAHYAYPKDELFGYFLPIEQARIGYMEYTFYSDDAEPEMANVVNEFFLEASEWIITNGGIIDRLHGPWRQMILSRTPNYVKWLKTVKKMLDPNNILNPGKLWPEEAL